MPNFKVKICRTYTDISGLVLDLRSEDLEADEGTHNGGDDASILIDSTASWTTNALVGKIVHNITDGSRGTITANTATTVTATLAGGGDNDWDDNDEYSIQGDQFGILRWENAAPSGRPYKDKYSGVHDGGDGQATLNDSNAPWEGMDLTGMVAYNVTDGSCGWITANTDSTITATLSGGTDDDWDDDDVYLIADPRFGNAYSSDTSSEQPIIRTISGYKLLEFVKSDETRLYIPLENAFPPNWWTIAYEFWAGSDNTNSQCIFDAGDEDDLFADRLDSGGDYQVQHGSAPVAGAGDHPDGACVLVGVPSETFATYDAVYYIDGIQDISDTGTTESIIDADDAVWLGADQSGAGSEFLDGRIRTFKIWDRTLSGAEVDFLYQSLATDGEDLSSENRCVVTLETWTDDVVDTGDEYSRITRGQSAPNRFYLATVNGKARILIVAEVAGKVRRNAELNSKLFTISWIETPNILPLVAQDPDWSAVFDITVDANYTGHYSCLISREDGGGVIVHFDVEEAE